MIKIFNLNTIDSILEVNATGKLMKWIKDDYFIKTSSINNNALNNKMKFMYESYSEVITSKLAKDLGIDNVVKYKLCKIIIDNEIETYGCYCINFCDEDEKYINMEKALSLVGITDKYSGNESLELIYSKFPCMKDNIKKMVTLDWVILNEDRHYANFGILLRQSGEIRPAPIFDSGDSLFANKQIDKLTYSNVVANYIHCKPFYSNHDKQVEAVGLYDVNINIDKTLKLITKLSKYYGLPNVRAKFITDMLISRVTLLKND